VFSPSPEQVEYAEMLHRQAAGSLQVCRKLAGDSSIAERIIGFHAHQTVEKALKVALVLAGTELPRTHNLKALAELVAESPTELPTEIEDTDWLTPWAADLDYEEPVGLDRTAALAAAESAHSCEASLLGQGD
jgi:HEPN domain-containing protein